MDLNIHTSCLGIINVIRSDPELDVHKESYAVAKAAVIFLRLPEFGCAPKQSKAR